MNYVLICLFSIYLVIDNCKSFSSPDDQQHEHHRRHRPDGLHQREIIRQAQHDRSMSTDLIYPVWSFHLQLYFKSFGQREEGDPPQGWQILYEDAFWTQTVPNVMKTGRCYTYDPPYKSKSGIWYGIR